MKQFLTVLICAVVLFSCKNNVKNEQQQPGDTAYLSFGEKITDDAVLSKETMAEKYAGLKEGDTLAIKFASNINDVCKSKGCWMKLDLGNNKESMVRFTDYGFFVPMDADNKEVIVEGRAFVTKTSVEELQHYAKDAGKSEEEIATITEPEFTYAFEADGVLIKK